MLRTNIDEKKIAQYEEWVKQVNINFQRVLMGACYEGYEMRKLKEGLKGLLTEVEKRETEDARM